MFHLHTTATRSKVTVIIDIGSGSVGAALSLFESNEKEPRILWTTREYLPIHNITSTTQPLHEIVTSVVNIFLQIAGEGMQALHAENKHLKVSAVQVYVSAPWSHTVTRTINFTDEHPFEVDQELIDELSSTAQEQAFSDALENTIIKENDLEIVHNQTIAITVNGYPVKKLHHATARHITLSHLVTIIQKKIFNVVQDSSQKVFPEVPISIDSYMSAYYQTLMHQQVNAAESCLIHITSEATEVAIIRDSILTHVTHIAFGTLSIAREIAATTNIPKEEAYTYLVNEGSASDSKLSKAKQTEVTQIYLAYENKIKNLLKQTGDTLAIPKSIFLHTPEATDSFFRTHIAKAAKQATGIEHVIHLVTHTIFTDTEKPDTSLQLLTALQYANYIEEQD